MKTKLTVELVGADNEGARVTGGRDTNEQCYILSKALAHLQGVPFHVPFLEQVPFEPIYMVLVMVGEEEHINVATYDAKRTFGSMAIEVESIMKEVGRYLKKSWGVIAQREKAIAAAKTQ